MCCCTVALKPAATASTSWSKKKHLKKNSSFALFATALPDKAVSLMVSIKSFKNECWKRLPRAASWVAKTPWWTFFDGSFRWIFAFKCDLLGKPDLRTLQKVWNVGPLRSRMLSGKRTNFTFSSRVHFNHDSWLSTPGNLAYPTTSVLYDWWCLDVSFLFIPFGNSIISLGSQLQIEHLAFPSKP